MPQIKTALDTRAKVFFLLVDLIFHIYIPISALRLRRNDRRCVPPLS